MTERIKEAWGAYEAYDRYVGRWSRLVAGEFLAWLAVPAYQTWSDIGCGSGALVEAVRESMKPISILAIDRARGFVDEARRKIADQRVSFGVADAAALPWKRASCDVTISGLVLNFVKDVHGMMAEMARVTKPGGRVAAYVWDYSGGMEMMRIFWDAAVKVNPGDAALDQAERFPICQPDPLKTLFEDAGLAAVSVRAIDVPTVFRDFDDYWTPFLGRQGAAPTYLASQDIKMRDRIKAILKDRLVPFADGSIRLMARAWAVQGMV